MKSSKPAGAQADRQNSSLKKPKEKTSNRQEGALEQGAKRGFSESYAWGDTNMQVSEWISARWAENQTDATARGGL